MTSPLRLAPAWALGALGLHAAGDPHAADGCHYRLYTDPRLGLPRQQIEVTRYRLGLHARQAVPVFDNLPALRDEVVWLDAEGRRRIPPFAVTPDNPVTGHLPTNGASRAIWLGIDTGPRADLRADIFRRSARGPRLLGARDRHPLSLGASAIDGVVVSGTGEVRGLRWLDAWRWFADHEGAHPSAVRPMALPSGDRPRYEAPAGDNVAQSARRVRRGAPARLGLHDEPSAGGPGVTSPADADDEERKARAQSALVAGDLDALLDDTDDPQHALERRDTLADGFDPSEGQPVATYRPVDLVHAALHDPTMARWLGFLDLDTDDDGVRFEPDPGEVVVYRLSSRWVVDDEPFSPAELASFVPSLGDLVDALDSDLVDAVDDELVDPVDDDQADGDAPLLGLWVPAVVVGHAPPLAPPPPIVGREVARTSDGGVGPWLPSEPPAARREATIAVGALAPGAGLAFALYQRGHLTGLNERIDVAGRRPPDRALLLVPAVPADAPGATRLG